MEQGTCPERKWPFTGFLRTVSVGYVPKNAAGGSEVPKKLASGANRCQREIERLGVSPFCLKWSGGHSYNGPIARSQGR
mgnify:CR=1 FL=1